MTQVQYSFTIEAFTNKAEKAAKEFANEKMPLKQKIAMLGLGIREERSIVSEKPCIVRLDMKLSRASATAFNGKFHYWESNMEEKIEGYMKHEGVEDNEYEYSIFDTSTE